MNRVKNDLKVINVWFSGDDDADSDPPLRRGKLLISFPSDSDMNRVKNYLKVINVWFSVDDDAIPL